MKDTASTKHLVEERLQVLAPVLQHSVTCHAPTASAHTDLGKHIRQVAEQAKDKVLRLQRACERAQ
jgi:hypothetical protein